MRARLILDDNVAARLEAEARRAGRPFREIVNDTLRQGLENRPVIARRQTSKTTVRDLGELIPGLSLDDIADLVAQVEDPLHR